MAVKDLHRDLQEKILIAHLVEIMMAQQLTVIMMAQQLMVADIIMVPQIVNIHKYGSLKELTSQTLQIALTRVGVTQNQTAQNSTMLIWKKFHFGKVEFSHNKKF